MFFFHQQNVQIIHVFNNELSQFVRKVESSFLIVTITYLWDGFVASESFSHSVVDTRNQGIKVPFGSSRAGSEYSTVQFGLKAAKFGSALIFDSLSDE